MPKKPLTEDQKKAHAAREKERYWASKEAKKKEEEEASEKAAEKARQMRERRAKKRVETEAAIQAAEAAVQEAYCKSSMDAGIAFLDVVYDCRRHIVLLHIV